MNEQEVEKQIKQMVDFIRQEAEEKANEIRVSAEEEFNIEKLQMLEAEKGKIKKEYERREGQIEVKKKIEYSKQLNEHRIGVLRTREEAIQSIVQEAKSKLAQITQDKGKYKKLLTDLIVQAAAKLQEKEVIVKCRKADQQLVKEAISGATSKIEEQLGPVTMKLDTENFLAGAPEKNGSAESGDSCAGGVVLTNADGSIVCSNTLDDRLSIAYTQNLPKIREQLFGLDAPVRS